MSKHLRNLRPLRINASRLLDVHWAMEPRAFGALLRSISPAAAGRGAAAIAEEGYPIRDGVAVIELAGVLAKGRSWWSTDRTMPEIQRQVEQAAADPAVRAILLRVDSPGGTVAGTSDLADAVWAARQSKPVTAYISDLGASAAYYVASQANRIYGDVDAMVGSIGVYCVVPDFSEMAAQEGVTVHVVKAGAMKGAGVPGTKVTDEQLADFQREIDQLNETFVDAVGRGRGWARQRTETLNDGRMHVGQYAVAQGLLDGIGNLEQALQGASESPALKIGAIRSLVKRIEPRIDWPQMNTDAHR